MGIEKTGKVTVPAIEHPLPEIHVYKITDQSLENMEKISNYNSVYSIGIGIFFTIFISFLVTICTINISDPFVRAIFTLLIPMGGIVCIVFVILYCMSLSKSKKIFNTIRTS